MGALSTLEVQRKDAFATIVLHRPDRLNAYTTQMGIELFDTLHELDLDDAIRAIIVTGAGRAFCAGADLAPRGGTFGREATWTQARDSEARVRPWKMRTPVIAALNGPAVGVGATLPLLWDIRIASDRARIGFVFTRRGIIPEAGSTWILPRLVGFSAAMDLLLTGRTISAHEALSLGLVSRVVPHDELLPVAECIARDIAVNTAPVSVAVTKRLLWAQLREPDPEAARLVEDRMFEWIGAQPDAVEGVTAFLEKRDPQWTLRPSTDLPADLATEGDPETP